MSNTLNDDLPEVLKTVRTRPLFVMRLDVRRLQVIGATPGGVRRIGVVPGGSFEGERLSGEVLDGGSDWQTVRSDGATTLNVRLVLKTKDDALIGMTYQGLRHGPPEVVAKSKKARRSIQRPTISAPIRCSRPQPQSTTGSTALSRSA